MARISIQFSGLNALGYLGMLLVVGGGSVFLWGAYQGATSPLWVASNTMPPEAMKIMAIGMVLGAFGGAMTWWVIGKNPVPSNHQI
jgi:hypothetical protein